jgi:hypothetical protein
LTPLTIMTTKRQIFVAAMIPGFVLGFERCRVVADLPARRHREVGAASTAHHYPEPLATGHNRVGSLGIILFSGQCLISRSETVLLYGERSNGSNQPRPVSSMIFASPAALGAQCRAQASARPRRCSRR